MISLRSQTSMLGSSLTVLHASTCYNRAWSWPCTLPFYAEDWQSACQQQRLFPLCLDRCLGVWTLPTSMGHSASIHSQQTQGWCCFYQQPIGRIDVLCKPIGISSTQRCCQETQDATPCTLRHDKTLKDHGGAKCTWTSPLFCWLSWSTDQLIGGRFFSACHDYWLRKAWDAETSRRRTESKRPAEQTASSANTLNQLWLTCRSLTILNIWSACRRNNSKQTG